MTFDVPGFPNYILTVPLALPGERCIGEMQVMKTDGRSVPHPFHFHFVFLHPRGTELKEKSPSIVAYRDKGGDIQHHLAYCELNITPEEATTMVQAWACVTQQVIKLEPRPRKRLDIAAYIRALHEEWIRRKGLSGRTRPPTHDECAQAAEGISDETSRKRLLRANPPTSWENLVAQWEVGH